jgi:thymidylate synthase ThyX
MNIQLVGVTIDYQELEEILGREVVEGDIPPEWDLRNSSLRFTRNCARGGYSEDDFDAIRKEEFKPEFLRNLVGLGHHSVFEHINLNFYLKGVPKIMAMIFNNEKQYATSEKSARWTRMEDIEPRQNELYNKWMDILIPRIDSVLPQKTKNRKTVAKKLGQENARYMTSVFTPTKMVHTLNWRQLNFIMKEFEEFQENEFYSTALGKRVLPWMKDFIFQTRDFRVEHLDSQTERKLSLFNSREVEEHLGDVYSIKYLLSFPALAQAHRHRTLAYHVSDGLEFGAPYGFFIPGIISKDSGLVKEWENDLSEVSKDDFPQAQLLKVNERGTIEDFRSKAILRMCGHAQYEIMRNTLGTATKYNQYQQEYGGENSLKPKCQQGLECRGSCIWGGNKALERLV